MRLTDELEQDTLCRGDDRARLPHEVQGDGDLLLVARRDRVCEDVHRNAFSEQVQRRLQHAHV